MSVLLQWLLLLACLAAAAPLLATTVARSPALREYIRGEARRAIRDELGLTSQIADIDLEPAKLSLVAKGITLYHPDEGRLVDAALLRIRPSWLSLMRGTLDLNVVVIENATVHLKLRDGKLVNLPELPETDTQKSPEFDPPLSFLSIRNAHLKLDAGAQGSGELSHIDVQVDATIDNLLEIELKADDGYIRHDNGEDLIHRLVLKAELDNQHVQIEYASLELPDASVGIERGLAKLPLGEGDYAGDVAVQLNLAQLQRLPFDVELPNFRGKIEVKGEVQGRGEQLLRGQGQVVLSRLHIDQFGLGERVVVQVQANPKRIEFDAVFDAIDNGGNLDLNGRLALRDGFPLTVRGNTRNVEFAKLMKQLGVSDNAIVDWLLVGKFELAGTTDPLMLRGPMHFDTRDFQITQGPYHERPKRHILAIPKAELDGQVKVSDEGIQLLDVDATLARSRLEVAEVLLGFDNALRVHAQGAEIDLNDPSPLLQFALDGQGAFDVDVTGTFNDPVVVGSLIFKRFGFNTFPFGDLSADFSLENDSQAVRFTNVEILKRDSHYRTNDLFMDFSEGRLSVETELSLVRLALSDFYDVFHYENDERWTPYQGEVRGTADIRYTLGFPGDSPNGTMRAAIDLDIPNAILDEYAFTDGHFTGRWDWYDHMLGYQGGDLTIDSLSLRKGEGTASISGHMRRGELDLVVLGDRIAVKDTEGFGQRVPGLSGTYGVAGTVKGDASLPRADLDLNGQGLRFHGAPLGETRAYVRLTHKGDPWIASALGWPQGQPPAEAPCGHGREGLARGTWPEDPPLRTIDGPEPALLKPMAWVICGEAMDGQIQIDMAVGRTKPMPLRGRVKLSQLALGTVLPRGPGGEQLEGIATGHLHLTDGAMLEPSTLGGEVYFSTLRAGQMAMELQNSGPVHVRFDEGSLNVLSAEFIGPASMLQIHGGGSTKRGLALTVDGNLDLGLLTGLSHTVTDATGRVDVRFKVSGMVDKPAIHGNAFVQDASLRVASFPEPIRRVNGNITFSEQRILLERFTADVAGGRLSWRGLAGLDGRQFGYYRLEIQADNLALRPRDEIDIHFGGRAELGWRRGDRLPKLSGSLQLDRFRYGRDVQVSQSIQDIYKKKRAEVETYDPDADILAIDLRVLETEPLIVQNNLIDAQLLLDTNQQPFRIVGTDQRFGVLGNMRVKRGILRYRDTSFDIREGEFRFSDPTRVDPTFDIRAVTDVRRRGDVAQQTWHIMMHAWGDRDEFRWNLTSDPNLSEDDIALLLTLGMTHAELAQVETGDLTSTAALEALATVTGVEREVQRALPTIDDFRVQSAYSQRSNRTEPQVYIGKRIADRVRLSAATGVGESRDFRTGVELQVSDQTSVQAVYDNQNATSASQVGDVGVDFKWRLEFD